jgi:hypothetical protein
VLDWTARSSRPAREVDLGGMTSLESCPCEHHVRRRVHRRSHSIVFLGHVLLAPALLVTVFASMGVVGQRPDALRDPRIVLEETTARLGGAGVPATIAAEVATYRPVAETELAALTTEQRRSVLQAQVEAASRGAQASMQEIGSGASFWFVAALALASATIGAWLVRKQDVLQCTNCGAVRHPPDATV